MEEMQSENNVVYHAEITDFLLDDLLIHLCQSPSVMDLNDVQPVFIHRPHLTKKIQHIILNENPILRLKNPPSEAIYRIRMARAQRSLQCFGGRVPSLRRLTHEIILANHTCFSEQALQALPVTLSKPLFQFLSSHSGYAKAFADEYTLNIRDHFEYFFRRLDIGERTLLVLDQLWHRFFTPKHLLTMMFVSRLNVKASLRRFLHWDQLDCVQAIETLMKLAQYNTTPLSISSHKSLQFLFMRHFDFDLEAFPDWTLFRANLAKLEACTLDIGSSGAVYGALRACTFDVFRYLYQKYPDRFDTEIYFRTLLTRHAVDVRWAMNLSSCNYVTLLDYATDKYHESPQFYRLLRRYLIQQGDTHESTTLANLMFYRVRHEAVRIGLNVCLGPVLSLVPYGGAYYQVLTDDTISRWEGALLAPLLFLLGLGLFFTLFSILPLSAYKKPFRKTRSLAMSITGCLRSRCCPPQDPECEPLLLDQPAWQCIQNKASDEEIGSALNNLNYVVELIVEKEITDSDSGSEEALCHSVEERHPFQLKP